jgi:hypothetical protein
MVHPVVNASKLPMFMVGVLALILGVLILGLLIQMRSGGFKPVPVFIGLALSITFAGVVWIYLRGHRQTVKDFTDDGLGRNDGKQFAWSGLRRVVDKMAIKPGSGEKRLWRTEIQFNDGSSAWLIPSKISNFDEVYAYVSGLRCEHIQEDA